MFIYNMIHKRLDRATESKLAYTTDDDRFWLVEVEIQLLHELSYRLRGSDGLICHDERIAKKCLDMRCPVPKGTHMEALGWYVISREELLDKHGTC
jgi:hypothetical protein